MQNACILRYAAYPSDRYAIYCGVITLCSSPCFSGSIRKSCQKIAHGKSLHGKPSLALRTGFSTGAEGFEPSLTVLETGILPLEDTPTSLMLIQYTTIRGNCQQFFLKFPHFLLSKKRAAAQRKICISYARQYLFPALILAGKFLANLTKLWILTVHCNQYRKRCQT